MRGFRFSEGEVKQDTWSATAFFVGKNTIATNAHVMLHATSGEARDDYGNTYAIARILALDPTHDLALLRVTGGENIPPIPLASKPTDPKGTLVDREVRAYGNTGGYGLSAYRGHINNFIVRDGLEVIIHDAQTSLGSSGGPVIDAETHELLGVTFEGDLNLRSSRIMPSWVLADLLHREGTKDGRPLTEVFQLDAHLGQPEKLDVPCLGPRETRRVTLPKSLANEDVKFSISTQGRFGVFQYGLVNTNSGWPLFFADEPVKNDASFYWHFDRKVSIDLKLENGLDNPVCLTVQVTRLDWTSRLR